MDNQLFSHDSSFILTISNYSSHLPAHLYVHLYTYLSLTPPKGRYIHWLCFLLNYHTLNLAGMKVHQQNENLEKLQFIADTEQSLPACLALFLCQLCTEKLLCIREVLHWIKCVTQHSHNSTPEMEIKCEIVVLKDTLPHHDLFLYLSLFSVVFSYLFLPLLCLNSGMS